MNSKTEKQIELMEFYSSCAASETDSRLDFSTRDNHYYKNLKRIRCSRYFDNDDECNSWKAIYAAMRVPLPEA